MPGAQTTPAGRVALVEPDGHIVSILLGPFEAARFHVEVASSGAEGLILCRQSLPQVALIDTELPDTDGLQVCRELRSTSRTRHIHVVLLARSMDRQLRIAGLETGADDFILVPFDPDEVTLRVRNALRRAAADNLTDPVTGLPGSRLIRTRLRELIREDEGWALLGLTVRRLKPFEEGHGFLAAQELLRTVSQILVEGSERWGTPDDFVGHGGGGRFVVATRAEQAAAVAEGLPTLFLEKAEAHYTFRERERGHMVIRQGEGERTEPLMHLEVHQVLSSDGPFYDIRSLTEALGQAATGDR